MNLRRSLLLVGVFVIALSMSGCGTSELPDSVQNVVWEWIDLVETEPASQSLIPISANYTIAFLEDNQVSIRADCNMVQGTYAYDGTTLTIELGASTMAFCGEDSLDNLFLTLLSQVGFYEKQGGRLNLISVSETITMGFKGGGTVE